jgi:hypothetical protein
MIAQLVVLSHNKHVFDRFSAENIPSMLTPVASLMGIVTILNMPLRDPMLPNDDISPVYSPPTVSLRTPEDRLTPWQYMTVAWMAPLIQEGYKRQLNDEDVWDLPWEFKHARLHATFRKLSGSVTRKIFVANGMDVIRTTIISVVRLVASKLHIYINVPIITDHGYQLFSHPSSFSASSLPWKSEIRTPP